MRWAATFLPIVVLSWTGSILGQQVTNSVGYHNLNNGFYEQMGTSFSGSYRGITFQGPGMASPQFGMPNSSPMGQAGFSMMGNGLNLKFNGFFGQGYSATNTSQTPMVTTMNGQPGYFSDTSVTPFVLSYVPVVGGVTGPFQPVMAANPFGMFGTAVQLPTWSAFGVGTTVSVPDGGSTLLGGVNRASEGRNEVGVPGLPGNRAIGRQTSAANTRVTAKIHDLKEMDEAILAGAPQQAASAGAGPQIATGQGSSATQAAPSVADAKRLHDEEQAEKTDDGRSWYERGLAAEEGGKPSVAKIYYQMAVRRTSGEVRDLAQARLDSLRRASIPSVVARRDAP
jgi:ribosomal protein L12E/L44/L45/RPP1/RPP2